MSYPPIVLGTPKSSFPANTVALKKSCSVKRSEVNPVYRSAFVAGSRNTPVTLEVPVLNLIEGAVVNEFGRTIGSDKVTLAMISFLNFPTLFGPYQVGECGLTIAVVKISTPPP